MSGTEPTIAASAVKVSVVVPVYNPGEHIQNLVRSLRRQSMPTADFEVLFVDDGSTDGTGALLDDLAAEGAPFRVIHIPNSGWPGKPRNIGVDAAVGEYVFFVDNDDALGDEALERMHGYAVANHSDVLIGKEVRRNVRKHVVSLWSENQPNAKISLSLLAYLNPHKMFRRQFLLEHGLRFPEGPRRLEDHPFVMKAYFAADVISVLADYPCYYWIQRPDRTNAGLRDREWGQWYSHLRDALDVVEAHTQPGTARDELLSHWYRSKGLRLLTAPPGFHEREHDDALTLFNELRKLTLERYPPGVDRHLRGIFAVTSQLLRDDQFDRARALATATADMYVEHRLESCGWEGGELELRVWARLVYADGSPVLLQGPPGEQMWLPPLPLDDIVDADRLRFGSVPRHPIEIAIRHRHTGDNYPLPGTTEPLPPDADGRSQVGSVRTVRLDPATAAMGSPLVPGLWEVDVQLGAFGWWSRRLLRTSPPAADERLPVAQSSAGVVSPYVSASGYVVVAVGTRARPVLAGATPDPESARLLVGDATSELDVALQDLGVHGPPLAVEVVLRGGDGAALRYPGQLLGAGPGQCTLRATLPGRAELLAALASRGTAPLVARLGAERLPLGLVLAPRRGQPVLRSGTDEDGPRRTPPVLRDGVHVARRLARAAAARLTPSGRGAPRN